MDVAVLDTDVASFFAKSDTRAALYLTTCLGKQLCISFQTVAELRLWTIVRGWAPSRRSAMEAFFQRFIVLPYDSAMAQHWAEIAAHCRSLGRPINCGDAWIAASALRHDALLLTHDAKDYEDIPRLRSFSHQT